MSSAGRLYAESVVDTTDPSFVVGDYRDGTIIFDMTTQILYLVKAGALAAITVA